MKALTNRFQMKQSGINLGSVKMVTLPVDPFKETLLSPVMRRSFISNVLLYFTFLITISSIFSACNLTKEYTESVENSYNKMGQEVSQVVLDSSTVHWRRVGNGSKNLILIQGFGPLPMVQWKNVVKHLHEDFTIYIPDLIYFGESTSNCGDYSPKFQARQVYESFEKFNVGKAYIAGLSYGGLVAELIAHEHPEALDGLILIDALSVFYDRNYGDSVANSYGAASMREFLLPKNGREMKNLFKASYHKPFCVPGVFLNGPANHLYGDLEDHRLHLISYMYDYKEEIRQWDISYPGPVQIIWGEKDIIIPISNAYQLNEFYANSRLTILPKTGHVPNFENDKALARAIREFALGG